MLENLEKTQRIIKVAANSRTHAVAGAIAGTIREHRCADVQAIGAGAVNQAVKAIAIARNYLIGDGLDIVCGPELSEIDADGQRLTAIRFRLETRI
ncbi:MAG: stage V sporulation protein S [Anaerolineae bacterium]|nr:stage V sporulation protein S [Anaerolineae bacterium]